MIRAAAIQDLNLEGYPIRSPFDPDVAYPELGEVSTLDLTNKIYPLVRRILKSLGLDREAFGSPEWNPLGEFVGPGQVVLIKPNLVLHSHPLGARGLASTIAHPAVLRPLIDYSLKAVGERGRVIIGDTPLESCDFDSLVHQIGLKSMVDVLHVRGRGNIELLDFRSYWTIAYPDGSVEQFDRPGDSRGYTLVDLGRNSFLQYLEDESGSQNYLTLGDHTIDPWEPVPCEKGLPNKHHFSGTHRYNVPNSVLQSDLIINVAKLKTHKKSGVTLCLKNCIGLAQGKEYLPHYRAGMPSSMGGDSFKHLPSAGYLRRTKLRRIVAGLMGRKTALKARNLYREFFPFLAHKVKTDTMWGDWYGNDTIWRTTLDLNLVQLHCRANGSFDIHYKRKFLGIIDGVVGMDHEAPMDGLPRDSKLLIGALDPVAADTVGAFLMGFDPVKIPTIQKASLKPETALGPTKLYLEEVHSDPILEQMQQEYCPNKGWKEHLLPHCKVWPYRQGD